MLERLIFPLEKRYININSRGCAHCFKSHTIDIVMLMLSYIISAINHREMSTVLMPGAFLQAYLDKEGVYLQIRGNMAKLLVPAH